MDASRFEQILRTCASAEEVRRLVKLNYWDNQWWPRNIKDWRLKILLCGLSTRVAYRTIRTYQHVTSKLCEIGYDNLTRLSKSEFKPIVAPLGLQETRWRFWQSVQQFCERYRGREEQLEQLSNDELIDLLRKEIWGAGYKVAQASVLYIRGYHTGVIVVDSGMKDLLGPCLGFVTSAADKGHELMRKQLEALALTIDYQNLLRETGYGDVAERLAPKEVDHWWVHLVLIYFKREFCNAHMPERCSLLKAKLIADPSKSACGS